MASSSETKARNVALMRPEYGYDVTIVCCSDAQQSAYWQHKLDGLKGIVTPATSSVVAVDEDWPGGAGNFLGTLYAWRKACARHAELTGRDLARELEEGASVALFHTAGKGTRMAPLPGAENNNKPGVKLPAPGAPSILDCVIRQTGGYASSRKRRLSVFWGDQIFVPSVAMGYEARYHVDIACALGPMPGAEEWSRRGLEKYGLIAARSDGSVAAMLEKVTHSQASDQLAKTEGVDRVGMSLGSFSLSADFLGALGAGFAAELTEKVGKMDTDPHVWMPMTLDADAYAVLMVGKQLFDDAGARAHHARVRALVEGFDVASGGLTGGMFGAVDVGPDCSWWDYGQLKLYQSNSLLLTQETEDAALARDFFGVPSAGRVAESADLGACQVDAASIVSGTRAASGSIVGSALAGVAASEIQADHAVLLDVVARRIVAPRGSILYNIVDQSEEGIVLAEDEVRVGVFTQDPERPYFEMRSNAAEVDGGKVFKDRVCGNSLSFQEVYDLNHGADIQACAAAAAKAREERKAQLAA